MSLARLHRHPTEQQRTGRGHRRRGFRRSRQQHQRCCDARRPQPRWWRSCNNFTDFLQMLMTQLQNQDPTSPMDTSQFTTELVTSSVRHVEQQINTNAALTQLIQLTQAGETMQGTSMTGKQVTRAIHRDRAAERQRDQLNFSNDPTAGTVAIAITNSSGQPLLWKRL